MTHLNDAFDWASAPTLQAFLDKTAPLSEAERRAIIVGATTLLSTYYVHLPDKCRIHGIDPVGELRRLSEALPAPDDDVAFHAALCEIFARLRDMHTQYVLPAPYQNKICLLPFRLGMYRQAGRSHYVVTSVQASFRPDAAFDIGAEILTWCNAPMEDVVTEAATHSGGASDAARRARALMAMTIHPLERQAPPRNMIVTCDYRAPGSDAVGHLRLPWRILEASAEAADPALAKFIGIDYEGEARRHAVARAYHPQVFAAMRRAEAGERLTAYPERLELPTDYPSIFRAQQLGRTHYGYLRICSFAPPSSGKSIEGLLKDFTREFARLICELPPGGLVLDVRGNGGGFMPLAESLLQVLASVRIMPQPVELLANPEALSLCHRSSALAMYIPSMESAIAHGRRYSDGFPLTKPAWCNWHEQCYFGPVVLITDALSYSATDAFAAGFQDHAIGKILGVSPTTGAGGANVWRLDDFIDEAVEGLTRLPRLASLRVAFRRTRRVGTHAGDLVEEVGVVPDFFHQTTRDDLLHEDRDLLAHAAAILARL